MSRMVSVNLTPPQMTNSETSSSYVWDGFVQSYASTGHPSIWNSVITSCSFLSMGFASRS
jgi:hypothetical protein